ncbi:phosphoribosyl-AMP cyclohydrolase [Guyparkeria sp. 1SP6A2]|nr:phosphoribosyl-AMP cyclohydrolase [Guyparkeria sp. 1SP6A2]
MTESQATPPAFRESRDWLEQIVFDQAGLVPAIAQDHATGRVLMFAWMNREAVERTVELGEAVYFSRSRQQLWHKGEQSGHTQKVHEIRLDCDGDVLLLSIEQAGHIACHTGRESCFYRRLEDGAWRVVDDVKKSPGAIYGKQD